MSDSDEDNNIRYGTPLEPFEDDEVPVKKKFQKETADQYALDSHGRRRFHGAFTGGFSAGFGNSVATPEGFTPATFKSSRSEKAQMSSQKAVDFMDEEDRAEFGIAPRLLQTQSDFSGQKRQRQTRYHDGPIPGEPVLEDMLRPVHETAAVRILKSMGWRPGQGTGARLTAKEKKQASQNQKVYGCYMPPDMRQDSTSQLKDTVEEKASETDSDTELDYEALFAPEDYEPYILQRKNDRFGLGYSGLSRHSVLGNLVGEYGKAGSSMSHLIMKDKGKKVSIRGQAFGVGALEEDDEDIYATEDMSHYDFALGAAKTQDKGQKKETGAASVLQGFIKAKKPPPTVPSYPAPALPRDYQPAPAGARRTRFEKTDVAPRDQGLGRHELTAEARGALLGETPIPKQTPLPQEPQPQVEPSNDDPIAKVLGRNVNFTAAAEETVEKELDYISIVDSNKDPPKVFKPFAADPQKQLRYERFLKNKEAGLEGVSGMDKVVAWERDREMAEFDMAAKLYKPLTGFMQDRFTHASQPDDQPTNPLYAVAKSNQNRGLATKDQIEAAAKGLFGVLTRSKNEWRPDSLVCKRFNIPDPFNTRPEPKKNEKSRLSYSIFEHLEPSVHDKESFRKEQSNFSGSRSLARSTETVSKAEQVLPENKTETVITKTKSALNELSSVEEVTSGFGKRLTVAELFLRESEKDLKQSNSSDVTVVTETINKFDKAELYKAIFLSDSEDELNESDKNTEVPKNDSDYTQFIDVPKNVVRNQSPPKGIFANINFDELNAWNRNTEVKKTAVDEHKDLPKDKIETEILDNENNLYGPKIPENLQKRLQTTNADEKTSKEYRVDSFKPYFVSKSERDKDIQVIDNSSSSDSWVELTEKKHKKVKKKTKKHKSKSKKSKHKKKDR